MHERMKQNKENTTDMGNYNLSEGGQIMVNTSKTTQW
jgi:hypothetical protein